MVHLRDTLPYLNAMGVGVWPKKDTSFKGLDKFNQSHQGSTQPF